MIARVYAIMGLNNETELCHYSIIDVSLVLIIEKLRS